MFWMLFYVLESFNSVGGWRGREIGEIKFSVNAWNDLSISMSPMNAHVRVWVSLVACYSIVYLYLCIGSSTNMWKYSARNFQIASDFHLKIPCLVRQTHTHNVQTIGEDMPRLMNLINQIGIPIHRRDSHSHRTLIDERCWIVLIYHVIVRSHCT